MGALSTHAVNPSLYSKMPYDAQKDFAPITRVAITPNVLVVNPALPVNSVRELIAYAKAHPGKLSFGSGSTGSAGHLAGELLKVDAGVDMVHIPYKGAAPAMQALLAGDTQLMFDNLANAMAQVKAGKLRALAVTTAERSKLAPDLPTMAEAGVSGFDISTWFGLFAPAGTPPDVVAKWNADVTRILDAPDMRERLMRKAPNPRPIHPPNLGASYRANLQSTRASSRHRAPGSIDDRPLPGCRRTSPTPIELRRFSRGHSTRDERAG
jgi:tripartite-type tricarboxylate transporter receptor subunit TctC